MTSELHLGILHYHLVRGLLDNGRCPTVAELASTLERSTGEIRGWLDDLAATHGVVLDPGSGEPWVLHPFSLTPTLNYVECEAGSWWAPCLWCAFGVSALAGGHCRIHTRLGAEHEPLIIDTNNGVPITQQETWVHFAVPPARAWENVHRHCALVLPFRSERDISEWCARRGVEPGAAVPLRQVALLAIAWYGDHASPQWRKWSVAEAQALFHGAGLTSSFWDLPTAAGKF